jgi:hypothetical protein
MPLITGTDFHILTQVFDLSWSRDEYQDSLLWDASKPFSSVDVLVRKGVATNDPFAPTGTRWFAWQRWAKLDPPSRGHFGFAYAKPEGDRMCLVDATNANRQGRATVPNVRPIAAVSTAEKPETSTLLRVDASGPSP